VSDEDLRTLARAIALAPDSLELRRQHVHLLRRAGDEEAALAALDLAWRLGADEVGDELQAGLQARRLEVAPGLVLRWVPAGPFVMGTADLDADAAPPHLVELSGFWIGERALTWRSLQGWSGFQTWRAGNDALLDWHVTAGSWAQAREIVAHLERTCELPGLGGRWSLPSEAQWERAFRAAYLRPDGTSPYGVLRAPDVPEWIADAWAPDWYARSPRLDPAGPGEGELRVVRGAPGLPDPEWALFREAASLDGQFQVGGLLRTRWVRHEGGIALRPVFVAARY
jgi:formylglycine-generating enzyme required for sulfatase activity